MKLSSAEGSYFEPERVQPGRLVDGNTDDLGFHTILEDDPWVTIDLLEPRPIARVVVHNRISHRERTLPLLIEASVDGNHFLQFARRYEVFEKWTARRKETVRARWVRLRVEKRTYFHLNEVEVFER